MNEELETAGIHYCGVNAYHWVKARSIAKARARLRNLTADSFIRKTSVGCMIYSVPGETMRLYEIVDGHPDVEGFKLVLDLEVN